MHLDACIYIYLTRLDSNATRVDVSRRTSAHFSPPRDASLSPPLVKNFGTNDLSAPELPPGMHSCTMETRKQPHQHCTALHHIHAYSFDAFGLYAHRCRNDEVGYVGCYLSDKFPSLVNRLNSSLVRRGGSRGCPILSCLVLGDCSCLVLNVSVRANVHDICWTTSKHTCT